MMKAIAQYQMQVGSALQRITAFFRMLPRLPIGSRHSNGAPIHKPNETLQIVPEPSLEIAS